MFVFIYKWLKNAVFRRRLADPLLEVAILADTDQHCVRSSYLLLLLHLPCHVANDANVAY